MASNSSAPRGLAETVALGHGIYYLVTGIWPLLSMKTFELITGRKTDRWLVRAAGLLIAVIGAVLTMASARHRVHPETTVLGAGSAASLAGIDLVYGLRGRISRVYVVEGIVELGLVAGWLAAAREARARQA